MPDSDDYVGYRHPPKAHRFKPGSSGNPGGKSKCKGPLDAETLLSAPVSIKKNGRKMTVDPRQLATESQFKRAFKGDIRAARACFEKCVAAGLLREWTEDEHQFVLVVPQDWDRDEWYAKYAELGPPPWPGERDGLVPPERRDTRRSRAP